MVRVSSSRTLNATTGSRAPSASSRTVCTRTLRSARPRLLRPLCRRGGHRRRSLLRAARRRLHRLDPSWPRPCHCEGCDVKPTMAEIFGRRTGLCKGKGGSMHIAGSRSWHARRQRASWRGDLFVVGVGPFGESAGHRPGWRRLPRRWRAERGNVPREPQLAPVRQALCVFVERTMAMLSRPRRPMR